MFDQFDLRVGRVLVGRRASLRTLARIVERRQVAPVTQHHGTHADADASLVHHVEHIGKALMRLAHQFTDALALFAKGKQGRCGAAIAHLVDQAGQGYVVALAQAAVGIDAELGHDEQRDALDAGRAAGNLGQHQVHDVFGQFVVTAGNEDLVADDGIGAVHVRCGAGRDVRQAGAGLRLGQRHGAEEAPGQQRAEVFCPLHLAAEAMDDIGVGNGEEGIGGGADVGALEQGEGGLRQGDRQLHAAALEIVGGGDEAGFAEGFQRLGDLGDHAYALAVEVRFVLVRLAIVRGELLFGHGQRRVEHRVEGLPAVLGVARPGDQGFGIEDFKELKVEVAAVDDPGHV
jgi:hypothetical protein